MRTNKIILFQIALLVLILPLHAQFKPMTDAEKDRQKPYSSIEKAKLHPDSVIIMYLNYQKLNEVPKELALFKNMIGFDLGSNNLKEIPIFIFNLAKLREVGFSHNQISVIPAEISKLKNLISFKMWDNKITHIPDELLDLPNLQVIEFKNNPIPKEEKDRIKKKYPNKKILF